MPYFDRLFLDNHNYILTSVHSLEESKNILK